MNKEEKSILECYEPAMSCILHRIVEKHKQYGTSFYSRSHEWMEQRAIGEVEEFHKALSIQNSIEEALDVSICWLLIAQKLLAGQKEESSERELKKNLVRERELNDFYWRSGGNRG